MDVAPAARSTATATSITNAIRHEPDREAADLPASAATDAIGRQPMPLRLEELGTVPPMDVPDT